MGTGGTRRDVEWVGHLVKAFGWMMPGHVKFFRRPARRCEGLDVGL